MNASIRLLCEPQRTLGFANIAAGYTGIGAPLAYPGRLVLIQNYTNTLLQFSIDGIDDHFPLAAGGQLIIDITSNTLSNIQGFFIARGQRFYVKQIGVPTSGSVYVTSFYGADI